MPSSYTSPYQLEKQFTGENTNLWGEKLNAVIQYIADILGSMSTIALTGDYALLTSNTGTNDTRSAVLKFTGGAGPYTITLPAYEGVYVIWNASSATLTMASAGAGSSVQIATTDIVLIFTDGTNVCTLGYGGASLKDFISASAGGVGASLPSLTGNAGKWLTNNATIAQWALPTVTDISNYASDQATKTAAATGLAIAFAVTL